MSDGLLVCSLKDLEPNVPKRIETPQVDIVLVQVDGTIHALEDLCSHAEFPLSDGMVRDCTIECDLHGSRFDLRNGEPLGPPATAPVPVYPVTVEGDYVYVQLEN